MNNPSVREPIDGIVNEYFTYLRSERSGLLTEIDQFANQLTSHGNTAFHETDAFQAVAVPADMAREDQLQTTLELIDAQANTAPAPFAVTISANHSARTSRAGRARVEENLSLIRAFQDAHDELPFSYFTHVYPGGTPIGDIREGQLGALIRLEQQRAYRLTRPLGNLILTSWDADTVKATPTYYAQIQNAYASSQKIAWLGFPQVRHDRLNPSRFPSANTLLAWHDLKNYGRTLSQQFSINIGAVALAKGLKGTNFREATELWERATKAAGPQGKSTAYLEHAKVTCSSRRLVSQMAQGGWPWYYQKLNSEAGETDNTTGMVELQQDISATYYNSRLKSLVSATLTGALYNYNVRRHIAPGNQVSPEGIRYAHAIARAGVKLFGPIHDTIEIVEAAITEFTNDPQS